MIVFIDESGDAGFKTRQGSSRSFIIALIIFDNEFDAEVTDKIIDDFKKKRNPSL